MGPRYRALSTISTIYKVIGALAFAGTILATISTLAATSSLSSYGYNYGYGSLIGAGGLIGAISVFIGGSLVALGIYAIGELFQLVIELAFNTRNTEANSRMTNAAIQNLSAQLGSRVSSGYQTQPAQGRGGYNPS